MLNSYKNISYKKWEEIVLKMQKKDTKWIKDHEVSRIAFYISDNNKVERNKLEHEMVGNLIFLEKNMGISDLTKLLHSAESLNLCANGLYKFPPLENSDDFASFVDNLKEVSEKLKKNIKENKIEQSLEDVKRVRKACGECHGVLNK